LSAQVRCRIDWCAKRINLFHEQFSYTFFHC
jgi:hypothetical protein